MSVWTSFDIPDSLLGKERESRSQYITTYQTEVLLPKKSQYAGYCFLHPSKLVTEKADGIAAITYNSDFTFTLIKKDREPGKRYKRYKLTVQEILDIYAPETAKVQAKQKKKETARLAQTGSVEIVYTHNELWGDKTLFLFRCGKVYYYGSGGPFGSQKDVIKRSVVVESVCRAVFEAAYEDLETLAEGFRMLQDVRSTVGRYPANTTNEICAIGDSFEALCDQWEAELLEKAAAIIHKEVKSGVSGASVHQETERCSEG